jgi:dihydropteroate synthase
LLPGPRPATRRSVSAVPTLLQRARTSGCPLLMGVVNVTPDSFSGDGTRADPNLACERIDQLLAEGADIIDIGGESTRPRFTPVPSDEQIRRTLRPVRHAVESGAVVSIDTTHPDVARAALQAGAQIVNDVSCLGEGSELASVTARAGGWLVLMHARRPMSAQTGFVSVQDEVYDDVVREVAQEWLAAEARAEQADMPKERILMDPGLGFNKTAVHSLQILSRLEEFHGLGFPLVVGPSRKSFTASLVSCAPDQRLGGTVAACLACMARGASILRVHDVLQVRQALSIALAVGVCTRNRPGEVAGV